jgi:hypothetical protein
VAVPVTVVTNTKNLGFPAAITQGLQLAHGEYLVLLNNDVVVTDGWLDQLIALANAKPRAENGSPAGDIEGAGQETSSPTIRNFAAGSASSRSGAASASSPEPPLDERSEIGEGSVPGAAALGTPPSEGPVSGCAGTRPPPSESAAIGCAGTNPPPSDSPVISCAGTTPLPSESPVVGCAGTTPP